MTTLHFITPISYYDDFEQLKEHLGWELEINKIYDPSLGFGHPGDDCRMMDFDLTIPEDWKLRELNIKTHIAMIDDKGRERASYTTSFSNAAECSNLSIRERFQIQAIKDEHSSRTKSLSLIDMNSGEPVSVAQLDLPTNILNTGVSIFKYKTAIETATKHFESSLKESMPEYDIPLQYWDEDCSVQIAALNVALQQVEPKSRAPISNVTEPPLFGEPL